MFAATWVAFHLYRSRLLGDRTLKHGMHGSDVRQLQASLGKFGYEVTISGRFGRLTQRQVRRFQVPDMADSWSHHRFCGERPAQFTSGSICHRHIDLFLSKRYQDRCMDTLRQFHFH